MHHFPLACEPATLRRPATPQAVSGRSVQFGLVLVKVSSTPADSATNRPAGRGTAIYRQGFTAHEGQARGHDASPRPRTHRGRVVHRRRGRGRAEREPARRERAGARPGPRRARRRASDPDQRRARRERPARADDGDLTTPAEPTTPPTTTTEATTTVTTTDTSPAPAPADSSRPRRPPGPRRPPTPSPLRRRPRAPASKLARTAAVHRRRRTRAAEGTRPISSSA